MMNELMTISGDAALPISAVRVAAWTLLHFFWQGALVAAALAGALALLRRASSHLRYGVACAALVVMAALPIATGMWLSARAQGPGTFATGGPALPVTGPVVASPATGAAVSEASVAPKAAPASIAAAPHLGFLDPALPWLVVLWLAGVTGLSFVHLGGWLRVRRLRTRGVRRVEQHWRRSCERLARRLGIRRPVELLESTQVSVPTALGWLKPMVLFPASTFTGLSPKQLESILAHELAHVRRHDYLINVLQVALETLLFYHPAVWWASRQVRHLREHCCDDLAVAVCGDRMIYARALADLEELRFATPVFALGADGGSLLERIRRLAGGRSTDESGTRAPAWMAGTLAAVALLATAGILAFAGQPGHAQSGTLDPSELGIRGPLLMPPIMIAQVTEEETGTDTSSAFGETSARSASDPTPPTRDRTARQPQIPIDDLIAMKMHGLDDLLDEVEGTAYADLPTGQLLEMARFGVDRELITGLDAAGYRDLQVGELVELAKFGIDGELIAELQTAGYGKLEVAELLELAKFGVDGDYIQEMRDAGYQPTSAHELAGLAKFGVDSDLIAELGSAGFKELPAIELVELAKFGVDGDYIQEMRDAGYQPASTQDLVGLAKFGVDGELIAELAGAGLEDLSAIELVELAKFGVDGDYIQEMRGTGYQLSSTEDLVSMAKFGVDADLVAELAELGYPELTAEELVELAKFGVDGDFIRELRDAGYDNVEVEDLARMARRGIDAEFLSKMSQRKRI